LNFDIENKYWSFVSGALDKSQKCLPKLSQVLKWIQVTSKISESRELAKDAAKEKKAQEAKLKEEKKLMIKQNLKRRRESCRRSFCRT
jgi:hypothetical protein